MILAKCTIDSIAILDKNGKVVALISDRDIVEYEDYKVKIIADEQDYTYRVYEDSGRLELVPKNDTEKLS